MLSSDPCFFLYHDVVCLHDHPAAGSFLSSPFSNFERRRHKISERRRRWWTCRRFASSKFKLDSFEPIKFWYQSDVFEYSLVCNPSCKFYVLITCRLLLCYSQRWCDTREKKVTRRIKMYGNLARHEGYQIINVLVLEAVNFWHVTISARIFR